MPSLPWRFNVTWEAVRDLALISLGALFQALGMRLFLVPAHLVGGGVSGMAQIIHFYSGWPIGLMVFLGNIPLFILGWRYLGGPSFALRTALAVLTFSFLTDLSVYFLPRQGLTSDLLLNTLYGGVVSGVGYGLVYRGRGTSGGSDILARILNHWRSVPISQSYLMVDAVIILAAGLSFGWERALYALVMLYISGITAESITEGTNLVRTVLIITDRPQEVAECILHNMGRGVTLLLARGGYTGAERTVIYTVVSRSEVSQVKSVVRQADPRAFMVIGHAHEVLGEGFKRLEE